MRSKTAEAARALDGLEIFQTVAVIICNSGDLADFPFRLPTTRNPFHEGVGSVAGSGGEQGLQSSARMLI